MCKCYTKYFCIPVFVHVVIKNMSVHCSTPSELSTNIECEYLVQFADQNRKEGFFNDAKIKAGTAVFPANRLVLSCFSPFFEKMFKCMKDYSNRTVVIQGVDEDTFKNIIEFIYTGKITINHENVMNLLAAADYLQMKKLVDFCFELLDSSITPNNCLVILSAAKLYNNNVLKSKAYHYISENATQVAAAYDFLILSKSELVSCISDLQKIYTKQRSIYELIITWIKFDETLRKSELSSLLQLINLNVLPHDFLEEISKENMIQENLFCANQVLAAAFHSSSKRERSVNTSAKVLIFGETLVEDVPSFNRPNIYGRQIYELVQDTKTCSNWILCEYPTDYPNLDNNFFTCTCAINLNNFLYAINSNDKESNIFCLDLKNPKQLWKKLTTINLSFFMKAIASFDDALVAVGGNNFKTFSSLAMTYNIGSDNWKIISPLVEARSNHCMISCCNSLYVLGGINTLQGISLSSVEQLCDLGGTWHLVSPMRHKRSDFAVVNFHDCIYAIGGHTRDNLMEDAVALRSVEKYDISTNTWSFVSELNIARAYHTACVFADKIFVMGGINEKHVKEIECFDLSSHTWYIVGRLNNNQYCYSIVST